MYALENNTDPRTNSNINLIQKEVFIFKQLN